MFKTSIRSKLLQNSDYNIHIRDRVAWSSETQQYGEGEQRLRLSLKMPALSIKREATRRSPKTARSISKYGKWGSELAITNKLHTRYMRLIILATDAKPL